MVDSRRVRVRRCAAAHRHGQGAEDGVAGEVSCVLWRCMTTMERFARRAVWVVAFGLAPSAGLLAQDAAPPKRPRIVGVAHAAFYVSDMAKARAFYEGVLGFASPYSLSRPTGGDPVFS